MAKMYFFPLDITYKVVDKKPEVWIFGRLKDGNQIVVIDRSFRPYFYVIPKSGESIKAKIKKLSIEKKDEILSVVDVEEVKKKFLEKEVNALKVFTNIPAAVPEIRSIIKGWDSVKGTYEFDVPFVRRYLIDSKIVPMALTEVNGRQFKLHSRAPAIVADKISPSEDETLDEPKILAFDIETYNPEGKSIMPEKYPVIMISFYGKNFQKVITWKQFKANEKYIEFVKSEAELIARFKEVIEAFKPDMIAGYYSDVFDLPYIETRAKKYKIKLDMGIDYSNLNVNKRANTKSKITGIVHLDVCRFIQKTMASYLDIDSFKLDDVAEELLGERKQDVDLGKLADTWDNHPNKLEPYCSYNLYDSVLTFRLAEKIMPNILEMVKIVGLPLFSITRMGFSQLVEWYLMKQAPNFNEIAPNNPNYDEVRNRRTKSYKGAFVFEPKPGLYKDIVIFDFRSLYPSIITSHNVSPATMNCSCCHSNYVPMEDTKKKYWFCKKKKGFIPLLIEDLIKRRMRIKDMLKKNKDVALVARQQTLKLLANAFYGYLGFFGARWYSFESAESVTAWGRYYIRKVIEDAQKEGFNVIYSDTDSVFIALGKKSKKESKEFAERINHELPGMMELEFEGFYPAGIFVSAKIGLHGAKKKYALLSEEGKLKITGFESIRRNISIIAKDVQREVLEIVLKENNPEKALNHVKIIIKAIQSHRIPIEKVIIQTQIQKEISAYESIGPHVAAAKIMKEKGFDIVPGMAISFVVVKGKGLIRTRVKLPEDVDKEDYDSDYYINNQIIPGVSRIFEALGYSEDDVLEKAGQSKLGKFF